jgi:hypothetical protein
MMSDFMNKFFGPLSKEYCAYFLVLSMFFFIVLIVVFFMDLFWIYKNFKSFDIRMFTGGVLLLINIFIVYFVNRLLYTMCSKALM